MSWRDASWQLYDCNTQMKFQIIIISQTQLTVENIFIYDFLLYVYDIVKIKP